MAFYAQRFVERDGLQVFDGHFTGQGDYMVELVYLAHGVVEDAGDDSAVAVARGSGVALAQAETADEGLAGFVEGELEAHAVGIAHAADEAVVFLHLDVAGVVALGLSWHENDFNLMQSLATDLRGFARIRSKIFNTGDTEEHRVVQRDIL